jgi:hypothetical protein
MQGSTPAVSNETIFFPPQLRNGWASFLVGDGGKGAEGEVGFQALGEVGFQALGDGFLF